MRLYKRGAVWWVYFADNEGAKVRVSTKQKDRSRAAIVAREIVRRRTDPAYRAAHEATLKLCADRFLADRQAQGKALGTLHMYRVKASHLVRLLGEDLPLAKVDARKVDGYVAERRREGASASTVGKELCALRGLLKLARRHGDFDRELSQVMPTGYAVEYVPRRRYLTPAEAAALLDQLAPDRAALVAFALGTGARWSELGRARREDVDLAAGTVRLRGTKTAASARTIPILSLTRPYLERALRDAPGAAQLFRGWSNVRRDLALACASAKLASRVTPNDLRRTLATWLVQADVPPSLVAQILGHADSRMVERVYGRAPVADLARLIEARLSVHPRHTQGRDPLPTGPKTST